MRTGGKFRRPCYTDRSLSLYAELGDTMPYMRIWRWQLAITAIKRIEPNLEFILGTLAKMDEELYLQEQRHRIMAKTPADTKLDEWANVDDAVGQSYLWVLGAYEAIRTLDQRLRDIGDSATGRQSATKKLKQRFERVRIPLAKLEAAKRNNATDFAFPRQGIDYERGIAWEVATDVVISRSELSDEFLAVLEGLQNGTICN